MSNVSDEKQGGRPSEINGNAINWHLDTPPGAFWSRTKRWLIKTSPLEAMQFSLFSKIHQNSIIANLWGQFMLKESSALPLQFLLEGNIYAKSHWFVRML